MKKIIALMLAVMMITMFAGCGGDKAGSAAGGEKSSGSEISGSIDDLQIDVCGMEIGDYWDDKVLRILSDYTNNGDYLIEPDDDLGYSIIATQNGEELERVISNNCPKEEYYNMCDIYPGASARGCFSLKLLDEESPVSIWYEFDDGEQTYEIDLSDLSGAPSDTYTLEPVTDTSWFKADGETVEIFDITYSVKGVEVIPGTGHNGEEADVLRVTYEAVSASDEEDYIGAPFKPFQDGLSLDIGYGDEESAIELDGAQKIQPGETVEYTYDYQLYSMDPVAVIQHTSAGQYGAIFTL